LLGACLRICYDANYDLWEVEIDNCRDSSQLRWIEEKTRDLINKVVKDKYREFFLDILNEIAKDRSTKLVKVMLRQDKIKLEVYVPKLEDTKREVIIHNECHNVASLETYYITQRCYEVDYDLRCDERLNETCYDIAEIEYEAFPYCFKQY